MEELCSHVSDRQVQGGAKPVSFTPVHSLTGNISIWNTLPVYQESGHTLHSMFTAAVIEGYILEILPSLRTLTLACSVSLSQLKMPLKW